jgi:hypothetical protein
MKGEAGCEGSIGARSRERERGVLEEGIAKEKRGAGWGLSDGQGPENASKGEREEDCRKKAGAHRFPQVVADAEEHDAAGRFRGGNGSCGRTWSSF